MCPSLRFLGILALCCLATIVEAEVGQADDETLPRKNRLSVEVRELKEEVRALSERLAEIERLLKRMQPKPETAPQAPPQPARRGKPVPKLFWDRISDSHKQEVIDAEKSATQPTHQWSLSEPWTVWAVTVADDNRTVLAGGSMGEWRLADIRTGNLFFALEHPDLLQILAVGVSPDGRTLALGSAKGLHLLERHSPDRERFFPLNRFVKSLDFSADGRLIAIAGSQPNVPVLRTEDLSVAYELNTGAELITRVRLSGDGRRIAIAAGHFSNTRREKRDQAPDELSVSGVWDLETRQSLFGVPGNWRGPATLVEEVVPARSLLTSDPDGIKLWSFESESPIATLAEPHDKALGVSRDGRRVLVDLDDQRVGVFDVNSKSMTQSLQIPHHWRHCCCLSPDGLSIVAGGSDGGIRVWVIE